MKKKDKFYCDNCNSLQEAERQYIDLNIIIFLF
jgi:hypothetical protein